MSTQFRVPVLEHFQWQQPVIDMTHSAPPVSPSKGDRYVVLATGTGAFTSHDNAIAWYDGVAWQFDVPTEGFILYNLGDHKQYRFSGSAWISNDISAKADKVSGAVNGDLAALDSSGNLTDSGISASSVTTTITQATEAYNDRGVYDSVLKVIKFNLP